MIVSLTHTISSKGSGIQNINAIKIITNPSMTAQPALVIRMIPSTVPMTPTDEALHIVNPIQTPKVAAIALPPRNLRNGLKTCPSMGAMAMRIIGIPRIPKL
jgi:predicted secreted protein